MLKVSKMNFLPSKMMCILRPNLGSRLLLARGIKYNSSNLQVELKPKSGLVDERLSVHISGLQPFERTSLLCTLVERKKTFAAIGHYAADVNGVVDTTKQPSFGGTYVGVEPEGLIWSMKTVGHASLQRLQKFDVTTPYNLTLKIFRDVLDVKNAIEKDADNELQFERWYMSSNVSRTLVRGDKIRGSFFMPSGDGPFIPVIDMFGGIGGLTEHRAALLASKGFAVMALAHFAYDDLPEFPVQIGLDYFEEAIHWLLNNCDKKIKNDAGVNVVGTCLGGMFALAMAEAFPEVSAVVSINGFHRPFVAPMKFKDIERQPQPFDPLLLEKKEYGDLSMLKLTQVSDYNEHVFEIEKSDARFLIIAGDLDESMAPAWSFEAAKRLEKRKNKDHELLICPGAGHLIEPPFSPFSNRAPVKFFRGVFAYGGETSCHARAQSMAWEKMLKFLKNKNWKSS